MKRFLLMFSAVLAFGYLHAQKLVTIKKVQEVSAEKLNNCDDLSEYHDSLVKVRGVVTVDGNLGRRAPDDRNIWIQDGTGPFSGLDVLAFTNATSPDDIRDLVAGDSIEVIGTIGDFRGETQITPETDAGKTGVTLLGTAKKAVEPVLINLGDLNDADRNNQLATGEQYEGMYVEIRNVTVNTVNFFSSDTRVSFDVRDENGNTINISDRFLAQRLPANGGEFVPPTQGTFYESIKGIVLHSKNNCPGESGRGYEINPFVNSHYKQGTDNPPAIGNVIRKIAAPKSSEANEISATVTDANGLASVTLRYATGVGSNNYSSVSMTQVDGTDDWKAEIPAQADGTFVMYYIEAEDNSGKTAAFPNVAAGTADPFFYTVRDNGLTVYDVQYTPFSNGNSGYLGEVVEIEGVITASAEKGNLGFVYMQEENRQAYAGISLTSNSQLATLKIGDKVRVKGTVRESFGLTQLQDISEITSTGTGEIEPVEVSSSVFSSYDVEKNEQYEGMLVKLVEDGLLYVVNQNADGDRNFAEYRVGPDPLDPENGCRVQAGRVTNSSFSSLNVSFINDSTWMTESGVINPDLSIVIVKERDSMSSLTGIMYYGFSNMKLHPRNNDDFENYNDIVFSVGEVADFAQVSVYPNPARNMALLTMKADKPLNGIVMEVYNILGERVVLQGGLSTEETISLNLEGMASGHYMVVLKHAQRGLLYQSTLQVNQ